MDSVTTAIDSVDWSAFLQSLRTISTLPDRMAIENTPLLRQEAVQQMVMTMAQAYMALFSQGDRRPHLTSYTNPVITVTATNPDCMYLYTALEGKGTYCLSGSRGTSLYVHVAQYDGMIGLSENTGSSLADLDLDSLNITPDGSFSVVISARRPDGYVGDWWPLDPKANSLFIRQVSYDWVREVDGRFAVECLDKTRFGMRMGAAEIGHRLKEVAHFIDRTLKTVQLIVKDIADKPPNTLHAVTWSQFGPMRNQHYYQGRFDIKPDDALIIETDVPEHVRYWGILLIDEIFNSINWMDNQSSLNGFQAQRDKDGRFGAVLALSDPGVPNWLDPAGHTRGMIQGRWFGSNYGPTPSVRLVKLSEVRKHLPAETPEVSADHRDEIMRGRRRGAQFRRKW